MISHLEADCAENRAHGDEHQELIGCVQHDCAACKAALSDADRLKKIIRDACAKWFGNVSADPFHQDIESGGLLLLESIDESHAALIKALAERSDLLAALKTSVAVSDRIAQLWDCDQDTKVGKALMAMAGRLPKYAADIDSIHAAIAKAGGK